MPKVGKQEVGSDPGPFLLGNPREGARGGAGVDERSDAPEMIAQLLP